MQVADLKKQLQEVAGRRSGVEKEIAEASARLEATGLGMHGPLCDDEGFPRADIDILSIRTDRHKVIVLSNDYKEMTNQMETLLHQLHALSREGGITIPHTPTSSPTSNGGISTHVAAPIGVPASSEAPFGVVDELSEGSPAATAGLKLGDRMIRFAHVTVQTPDALQAVARALAASEGKPVEAVVLREGVKMSLTLVPQTWSGRGLLGCHLQPIQR